jgi:nitrate reductase delta subunit
MNKISTELRRVLACISELWCNPQDFIKDITLKEAANVSDLLKHIDNDAGSSLETFLKENQFDEEKYIESFELDPKCSLYLGSHVFEEPQSCSQAATSDRNDYMIELSAIYRHFGFELMGNELPDYLPLIIEFLSLIVYRDDPIKIKLINEYILPYLPPLHSKLEAIKSPYIHLLITLENLIKHLVNAQDYSFKNNINIESEKMEATI